MKIKIYLLHINSYWPKTKEGNQRCVAPLTPKDGKFVILLAKMVQNGSKNWFFTPPHRILKIVKAKMVQYAFIRV